jgi:hypothetical protein
VNLVLDRSERALRDTPSHDDHVLWLGAGPIPESLRSRAVAVPADPLAMEGWLAIRRLGDVMAGGKSVKQRLELDGVSLWWFVHHWLLYGQGLPGWDERYRVLHRVVAGTESKPARMILVSPLAGDDLVARAVAARNEIPYEWAVSGWSQARARLLPGGRARALMGARLAKLLLRGLLARVVRRHPQAPVDLLFYTSSSTWDAARGTDRILGPVIADAEDRGLTTAGLHLDYRRNLGLDTLFGLDRRIVAWESLVTPGRAWRAVKRGRSIARSVRDDLPGEVLGVPAAALLADRLAALGARLSDAVLAIETARRTIKSLRPRCVYVLDGYDLWAQALVVAARDAGIPSVEVQHGIIEENHSGYLHLDGEISADRSQRSPFSPIPDTIAVHGDRAREALTTRGMFPPDSIQITGSPNIQAARRMQDGRHEMRARLKLPDDAFAVLYFGAPRHVHPAEVEHLRAFLDCCRAMPSLKPLLRPHPGDQDRGRYREAASAAGVDAPVLTEPDPFELILAADAVISHNSTTALDAMALERAVIHINMSGSPDLFRFVEDGGAIRATTVEELRDALVELSSPDARQRVVARQTPYAARYYAQCADPAGAMLEIGFPSLAKT